jgi:hypothetical protein
MQVNLHVLLAFCDALHAKPEGAVCSHTHHGSSGKTELRKRTCK